MTELSKTRLSEQEYLAGERDGLVRQEYIDGEVHAMAGGAVVRIASFSTHWRLN